jgi:hypothetical protein
VAAGEQAEAIVQPRREAFHPERGGAGRGQLDGEGDAVEPPTDRARNDGAAGVQEEPLVHRLGAGHEQLDRGSVQQIAVLLDSLGRHLEGEHTVDVFSGRAQWLAAGRQHADVGIGPHERHRHAGRRLDQMLAVVEHEQEALATECRGHALGLLRADRHRQSERAGDRDRHEPRVR